MDLTTAQMIDFATNRHDAYMHILHFFVAKGAIRMHPTDTFQTTIAVCDWSRPDMKGGEICALVDSLISECRHDSSFFSLERSCNCVIVSPVLRFGD